MSTQPVIADLPQTSPTQGDERQKPMTYVSSALFQGPLGIRSIAMSGTFLLLLLFAISYARDLLLPIILAFFVSLFLPRSSAD
jgi:hypothetical protein